MSELAELPELAIGHMDQGLGHGHYAVIVAETNELLDVRGNNRGRLDRIVRACNTHDELLAACKAQHEAIDRLFAMLITAKGTNEPFFPSKCGQPWEALCQGNAAIEKATNKE